MSFALALSLFGAGVALWMPMMLDVLSRQMWVTCGRLSRYYVWMQEAPNGCFAVGRGAGSAVDIGTA